VIIEVILWEEGPASVDIFELKKQLKVRKIGLRGAKVG
jgi:hypothetical protein